MLNKIHLHILNSVCRIQNCDIINDDINIYENYASKLINRYKNFDYLLFENSKFMYESILVKLHDYEN